MEKQTPQAVTADSSATTKSKPQTTNGRIRRILVPGLLVLGIALVAFLGGSWWNSLTGLMQDSGPSGYLIFYLAFILLTTFCCPVSVLGFSAGALFGPLKGIILMLAGGYSAGVVMLVVGRYLFRHRIKAWVSGKPKLAALDNLAQHKALRLNFLARLSPLNYGLECYTLASGKSSWGAYLLGLTAIVPSMSAQVWVGYLADTATRTASGQEGHSTLEWVLLGAGLVFFVVLSWQVGKLVKQAWAEVEEEQGP